MGIALSGGQKTSQSVVSKKWTWLWFYAALLKRPLSVRGAADLMYCYSIYNTSLVVRISCSVISPLHASSQVWWVWDEASFDFAFYRWMYTEHKQLNIHLNLLPVWVSLSYNSKHFTFWYPPSDWQKCTKSTINKQWTPKIFPWLFLLLMCSMCNTV